MRRKALPDAERKICLRLKELRSRLGITEQEAARRSGISKHLWHNFEALRSPVRCEVALRICRQMIISEEWLATGKFDLIEAIHSKAPEMERIYFHQCLDLQSEPEFLQIIPGTLFSDAYRDVLAAKYKALIQIYKYEPRIVMRGADDDEFFSRYLSIVSDRFLWLLENEAKRLGKSRGDAQRQFLRCQVAFSRILFQRFMGMPTPEVKKHEYDFLRAISNDEAVPLGPLHGEEKPVTPARGTESKKSARAARATAAR